MSIVSNGKQGVVISTKVVTKNKDVPWTEPAPLEKLNWFIHLTYARGEINICKSLIREQIENSCGRNEYAYYQNGIILKDEKKIQEALESFQICLKLNPKSVANIIQVANCLFLLRRLKLALEAYLEAEKTTEKSDWEICHKLGECLYMLGELANAKDYARRAVQLGKQEVSYALLIKILVADNDLRSAVAVSNAALEYCPDSIDMLMESGLLYLRTGQIQHAFERLTSVLALEPTSAKALLGTGSIIQSHEEFDVALSKYKLAVNLVPESVPLWNNIGMCFFGKQKYVAAASCLKRALWYSPLSWRVLYNLGLVHLTTKQPTSSFNFLCAAVNLRPDNGHAFMLLGCALMDLEDVENASRALKQALLLAPEDPNVIINALLCFHLAGDATVVATIFQKYRQIEESDIQIADNIKELARQLSEFYPNNSHESKIENTEQETDVNHSENDLLTSDIETDTRELGIDEV